MAKITSQFVIFGAIAAAAMVLTAVAGSFDQAAYAQPHNEQSSNALQNAQAGLIAANVAVPANVNVQDVDVAVVACVLGADTQNCDANQ